jgi:hypothetical protein
MKKRFIAILILSAIMVTAFSVATVAAAPSVPVGPPVTPPSPPIVKPITPPGPPVPVPVGPPITPPGHYKKPMELD